MGDITTPVLDTARGRPAADVEVRLEWIDNIGGGWQELARGRTDGDGRLTLTTPAGHPREGGYRLRFDTWAYFNAQEVKGFYTEVAVAFAVLDPNERYHVPLLLSPYGYSTYRGS
jgi:5-hydroxyisourate hydrolase